MPSVGDTGAGLRDRVEREGDDVGGGHRCSLRGEPVEYVVALLDTTGKRSAEVNIVWLMGAMGQRPLFPPNVSGWKANSYWVNASAMEGRARTAQSFGWASSRTYWDDGGVLSLAGGDITRAEITARTGSVPALLEVV